MAEKKYAKPTEAELEILQVLWEHGPSTVRFVNEFLNSKREVGYTTTLKVMQIMHEKGLLKRNTDSRTHIYEAIPEREAIQRNLLDNFVDNVFSGSAMQLVVQALGSHKPSAEELGKIKSLIEEIEKQRK
ncbi:MAG: BlaI/MecI/CopY family transcriptional regulator [Saprospiraceae bacterium]|jgi:predicted transcriptional regulator|nr:MAG: BlaI/MecI/CopY family transcriptional regulator [Bacteroidota bacterium]